MGNQERVTFIFPHCGQRFKKACSASKAGAIFCLASVWFVLRGVGIGIGKAVSFTINKVFKNNPPKLKGLATRTSWIWQKTVMPIEMRWQKYESRGSEYTDGASAFATMSKARRFACGLTGCAIIVATALLVCLVFKGYLSRTSLLPGHPSQTQDAGASNEPKTIVKKHLADAHPTPRADFSKVSDSIEEMATRLAKIESELLEIRRNTNADHGNEDYEIEAVLEKARAADLDGNHEMAALYWQNALDHSPSARLHSILNEYSESVFKSAKGDFSRYSDAVMLERMTAIAMVKVPAKDIPAAKELHTRCKNFRDSLLSLEETDEEEPSEPELSSANPIGEMVKAVDSLLREMEDTINAYAPDDGGKPTDVEYKILQLSGIAESTMSQIWLLDRSELSEEQRSRADALPGRLGALIEKFNAHHDKPILDSINEREKATPPIYWTYVNGAGNHQASINFFTEQIGKISDEAKTLRGTFAKEEAQKAIATLQGKITDERRQQVNEYQKFVANCCKLAFDSWDDTMNTGAAGYGRLQKNKGFKDVKDFIIRHVRQFAKNIQLNTLRTQTNRQLIYAYDNDISEALQRESGGPSYWDVKNQYKAFIITAIFGLYRIDQSLLTPETSRLYNDVWGKYYEKMDEEMKVWSVRWMVEEPKIKLEDF